MKLITDTGVEIPIENIKVANVQPGDIIVMRFQEDLNQAQSDAMQNMCHELFSGIKVVILSPGTSLEVIKEG
ncbi:MAG: hypothetical protein M0Z75_13685 [Nitrospiraceae bacterium]|nr:hypothetical protein [Nitrospiraceae bacterium]